jgi:glycerol-1-phosphate dehydrogenase [NAD(P)+]
MKTIWNLPVVEMMPFSAISEDRSVLLVSSAPVWKAVGASLHLNIAARLEAKQANTASWDAQLASLQPGAEVIYAVGGGLVADTAKYISAKTGLPLVVLPTALSVDAFLTAASGIRRDGCVFYIETRVPDRLVLDFETISRAPSGIRAAGITDVMSIATGSWDWRFAHEQGKNPEGMEFIPWVYSNALSILDGVLDCAGAAGRGDAQGLKTLFDCLAMEVQLCNQVGHARPEEGSEHYFAYAVENLTGHGLPHGDLVGPGILLMARLQGQDTERYEAALKSCHIPLDGISSEIINATLNDLPAYCRKHGLAFGLAHTLEER